MGGLPRVLQVCLGWYLATFLLLLARQFAGGSRWLAVPFAVAAGVTGLVLATDLSGSAAALALAARGLPPALRSSRFPLVHTRFVRLFGVLLALVCCAPLVAAVRS